LTKILFNAIISYKLKINSSEVLKMEELMWEVAEETFEEFVGLHARWLAEEEGQEEPECFG
jgi:hypothetical protein